MNWKAAHDLLGAMLFVVAVAVGLIPQLLPAIINSNLARGAFVLAKKNAIVKSLTSIRRWPIVKSIVQVLTSLREPRRYDRSLQRQGLFGPNSLPSILIIIDWNVNQRRD